MQIQHADAFRTAISAVLGAPPDPAPLEAEVLDVVSADGYRREHIKYQVSPGDWSYAYLLIPDNLQGPVPVVYAHHRHENKFSVGKSEIVGLAGDNDYAIGLELVQRGFIVFAPDAICFGERRSPKSSGDTFDLAYNFHQLALRLLRGETLLKKVLWDVSRGLDYLTTRSEVDAHAIGFMGCGYGANMALWSAALEPRIRATVAHGSIMSYREQLRRGRWFHAEFVVPRLVQVADVPHILSMIAPRACLLSSVGNDLDSAEIYQKALPTYQAQGTANRLSIYHYPDSTTFDARMRFNAYTWLQSWLKFS